MKPIIGQNALSDFTEWVHARITRCVSSRFTIRSMFRIQSQTLAIRSLLIQLQLASFKHVPMLFLYSKNDALANYRYVDEMITWLYANGAKTIRSKRWDDTDHVGHYRQRPEEYKNEIIAFLSHIDHL